MGLFDKIKEDGLMNVIRCDEPSYLVWKWRPSDETTKRENGIRFGSSLRVKDGEVAVFVYKQNDNLYEDFIEGPFDGIIETKNFPVLANIIGVAYDGDTPFQAEVYFINTAGIIQVPFGVPYFDLFDPRYQDFSVPAAVRGTVTFKITDYREFVKLHRLIEFSLEDLQDQVRDKVIQNVKGIVANIPSDTGMPAVQIERNIPMVNTVAEAKLKSSIEPIFGIDIVTTDISAIELDKTSTGYQELKKVTQDVTTATVQAQTAANVKNIAAMQEINAENYRETLRIQREEGQYAQHLQTQSANMAAFQVGAQTEVGVAGAQALGQMGAAGATSVNGSGGMNLTGMMTGMALGGAIGQNLAGTVSGMMNPMQNMSTNAQTMVPPPVPTNTYHVAVNGQASGPFDIATLTTMASNGSFNKDSLVWKQGMAEWTAAGNVSELSSVFGVPGMPPIPPVPPMN
ncbi:MAG: SPFH domain-containing protein [Clostridia bacterium]|nr:SPFH domain-containing protein [Clostridia bacterium]